MPLVAGLVQALLKIPKHKEALFAARDAMKAMSHSAKALTLVGDVYAHIADGREKVNQPSIEVCNSQLFLYTTNLDQSRHGSFMSLHCGLNLDTLGLSWPSQIYMYWKGETVKPLHYYKNI